MRLLGDDLPTVGEVVKYVGRVFEENKERLWREQAFEQKAYHWNFPSGVVHAKQEKMQHLIPLPVLGMGVR